MSIPLLEIVWPRKATEPSQKSYFLNLAKSCIFHKDLQQNPQMINVIILAPQVNQIIITEHNHEYIKVRSRHLIHHVHKCRRSIFQSK